MPRKAIYWRHPEKERSRSVARRKALTQQGYKGGLKNSLTYLKQLEWRKLYYNPTHRVQGLASERKYRAKIAMSGYGSDMHGRYFYAREKGTLKDGHYTYKPSAYIPKTPEALAQYQAGLRRKASSPASHTKVRTKRSPSTANPDKGAKLEWDNLLRGKSRKARNPRAPRICGRKRKCPVEDGPKRRNNKC